MTDRVFQWIVGVVDDDAGILRSLEYLLESADYGALLFSSGGELLESGLLQRIDCLISDMEMPGMQGHELVRAVRAIRPKMPVILITGYPENLGRLSGPDALEFPFFSKPFQGPELLGAVDRAVGRDRDGRSR